MAGQGRQKQPAGAGKDLISSQKALILNPQQLFRPARIPDAKSSSGPHNQKQYQNHRSQHLAGPCSHLQPSSGQEKSGSQGKEHQNRKRSFRKQICSRQFSAQVQENRGLCRQINHSGRKK